MGNNKFYKNNARQIYLNAKIEQDILNNLKNN